LAFRRHGLLDVMRANPVPTPTTMQRRSFSGAPPLYSNSLYTRITTLPRLGANTEGSELEGGQPRPITVDGDGFRGCLQTPVRRHYGDIFGGNLNPLAIRQR
jgi:hypothetical protein